MFLFLPQLSMVIQEYFGGGIRQICFIFMNLSFPNMQMCRGVLKRMQEEDPLESRLIFGVDIFAFFPPTGAIYLTQFPKIQFIFLGFSFRNLFNFSSIYFSVLFPMWFVFLSTLESYRSFWTSVLWRTVKVISY